MFCRFCGNSIPDDSKFCDKCGGKLNVIQPQELVNTEKIISEENEAVIQFSPKHFVYERPAEPEIQASSNGKRSKKRSRKKSNLRRFVSVLIVLFLVFNIAKAVVFFIDYKDFIFVDFDDLGMRDKDELIHSYINTVINDDYNSRFALTLEMLDVDEDSEDYTWTDKIKMRKLVMVSDGMNYRESICSYLGSEDFKCTYSVTESESVGISDIRNKLSDQEIDEEDIEKAENYVIELTLSDGGKECMLELELVLVRISRIWYVYSANGWWI